MTNRKQSIAQRVEDLRRQTQLPWTSIGELLHDVEKSGHWKESATSFSGFVRDFSQSLGLGEASLWRHLSAYRALVHLHRESARQSTNVTELGQRISPENLELFVKISRAAPPEVVTNLRDRLIDGTATRAELRATWIAFRPAIGGMTVRGRAGPDRGSREIRSAIEHSAQIHACVTNALIHDGGAWLGLKSPSVYWLCPDVRPVDELKEQTRLEFDVVAISQKSSSDAVEVHGIEIVVPRERGIKPLISRLLTSLGDREPYVDFLWVAQHQDFASLMTDHLPEYVGLIVAKTEAVEVIRPALKSAASGSRCGALLRSVLPLALRQ